MGELQGPKVQELLKVDTEESNNLVLPDFQRQFVWDPDAQKNLLCSLLAGIPIGSFLIQKGKWNDFSHRPLCYTFYDKREEKEQKVSYLLDGQQRLATIKTITSDIFNVKKIIDSQDTEYLGEKYTIDEIKDWTDLFKQKNPAVTKHLRNRWYLNFEDIETDENGEKKFASDIEEELRDLFNYKKNDKEPDDYARYIINEKITKSTKEKFLGLGQDIGGGKYLDICKKKQWVPLWLLLDSEEIFKDSIYNALTVSLPPLADTDSQKDNRVKMCADLANYIRDFFRRRVLEASIPCQIIEDNQVGYGIALFERVNTTGTRLTVYDLLVSRYGRNNNDNNKNLNDEIRSKLQKKEERNTTLEYNALNNKYDIEYHDGFYDNWVADDNLPSSSFQKLFVSCLALETWNKKNEERKLTVDVLKRKSILGKDKNKSIGAEDIKKNWEEVVGKLKQIFEFLHIECGIYRFRNLAYELMVLPLYWSLLRSDNNSSLFIKNRTALNRCKYWYWVSIFTGRYRKNQNSIAIDDCKKLREFLEGNKKFREIFTDIFSEETTDNKSEVNKILNVENYSSKDVFCDRQSYADHREDALRKACMQFLLSTRPQDWTENSKQKIEVSTITAGKIKQVFHEHHIIPQSYSSHDKKITDFINSPMNLTCITKKTNISHSDKLVYGYKKSNIDFRGHFLDIDAFWDIIKKVADRSGKNIDNEIKEFTEMRFSKFRDGLITTLKKLYKD